MTDNMEPITVPQTFRPVQIATVHGAAVFLAENPTLPMPAKVELSAHVPTLAVLHAIAAAYGSEVISTDGQLWYWTTIPVAVESLHGMTIDYTVFYREPETTPMDLPPRAGVVLPEGAPWPNVTPRERCPERWEGARCVHDAGHSHLVPHFYDDDERGPEHQHGPVGSNA